MTLRSLHLVSVAQSAPLNLKIHEIEPNIFIVSWKKVHPLDVHALVVGYRVNLTIMDGGSMNKTTSLLYTTSTSVVVGKLRPQAMYSVRVVFLTRKVSSRSTPSVFIVTPQGTCYV